MCPYGPHSLSLSHPFFSSFPAGELPDQRFTSRSNFVGKRGGTVERKTRQKCPQVMKVALSINGFVVDIAERGEH